MSNELSQKVVEIRRNDPQNISSPSTKNSILSPAMPSIANVQFSSDKSSIDHMIAPKIIHIKSDSVNQ